MYCSFVLFLLFLFPSPEKLHAMVYGKGPLKWSKTQARQQIFQTGLPDCRCNYRSVSKCAGPFAEDKIEELLAKTAYNIKSK